MPELTSEAQEEAASAGGAGRYHLIRGGVVSSRSWAVDLAAARSLCISCPALAACRDLVQQVPVSGVAAGLTEDERRDLDWTPPDDDRDRARLALGEEQWLELLGRAAEQWPLRHREGLPAGVLEAVEVLNAAGLTDREVAALLRPVLRDDIQASTVEYLRGVARGKRTPALPVVAS